MQQKHKHIGLNRYTMSILVFLVFLVIAGVCAVVVARHNRTDAAPAVKPAAAAIKSQFTFTGTPGWWQGATNRTSMALFHDYDCFTSVQYSAGTVDAAAELQKLQTSQAGDGGTATPGAILTATLQTDSGTLQYELHQYSLVNPGMKLMRGLELGYLPLPGGYVKIEGHCDTPEELPATIPALHAIKFSKAD